MVASAQRMFTSVFMADIHMLLCLRFTRLRFESVHEIVGCRGLRDTGIVQFLTAVWRYT